MQVTTIVDDTTTALSNLLDGIGKFSLIVYGDDKSLEFENTKYIKTLKEPFRATPRSNDIVILKDIFSSHQNPDILLMDRVALVTEVNFYFRMI